MSSPIPTYASRAHHHACWMAKIIYTIKKALFGDQLKEFFKPQMLDCIQNLVTFYPGASPAGGIGGIAPPPPPPIF